jgi:hypothetical protein
MSAGDADNGRRPSRKRWDRPMLTKRSSTPAAECPWAGVGGLTESEQLVVWAFRTWLEGPDSRAALANGFLLNCGILNAEKADASFERLAETLADHSRRTLGFHRAECIAVSASERTLLALIAAHQADDRDYAAAVVCWLVPAQAAADLARHARAFATVLARSGLTLPRRVAQPVPVEGWA